MGLSTDSNIFGTRLWASGGLTYHNASGQLSGEQSFNQARPAASPPLASTLVGSGNYIIFRLGPPVWLGQVHFDIRDTSGTRVSTGFTVEYTLMDELTYDSGVFNDSRFHTSSEDYPSSTTDYTHVKEVKLTFTSAASGFRIHAAHLYADPRDRIQARPGLWMADHVYKPEPSPPGGAAGSTRVEDMVALYAKPRKIGQFFDAGNISQGGSSHGEFYIFNSANKGTAVAPVIESTSPGDTTPRPGAQHVLYSLDKLTWSNRLVLPDIKSGGYSPQIFYIDTMHTDTPVGRVSVTCTATPSSWSSGIPVVPSDAMTATFYKTVVSSPPAGPDLWWASPPSVSSGQPVTFYGKGLAGCTWHFYRRGGDWAMVADSPAIATDPQTAAPGDQVSIVRGSSTVTSNIAMESLTLTMPADTSSQTLSYSVMADSSYGMTDIFHTVRVSPPLSGDLGLPSLIMQSETAVSIRPAGLTPGQRIEQRESVFSKPKAIITSTPRSMPSSLINSKSYVGITLSSRNAGHLNGPTDYNTRGMTRWFPSAAKLVGRPEAGPTAMSWVALNNGSLMYFDSATGPYIDPSTDIETADPRIDLSVPSMVFPSGAIAERASQFENETLSNGRLITSYTMIMVALIGTDPSPTYREVVTGQPQRLSTLPAHLMRTTSNAQSYANVETRYDKRYVTSIAERARVRLSMDNGFLSRRPVIVMVTVSRRKVRNKWMPYSRLTLVGNRKYRTQISDGPFSAYCRGQIGHTGSGAPFRVLEFLAGDDLTVVQENQIINSLDAIYGVLD